MTRRLEMLMEREGGGEGGVGRGRRWRVKVGRGTVVGWDGEGGEGK